MVDEYKTLNDSQSDGGGCMRGQDGVGCGGRRCRRRRRRTYLGKWRSQPESMLFCFRL